MNYDFQFHFLQTGPSSALILDRGVMIAEIRSLQLCNVRFQPDGLPLIGETVPMPLYWWQYHDHQHPERHAGDGGELCQESDGGQELVVSCRSSNASASIQSRYRMAVRFSPQYQSYVYDIQARLIIPAGARWHVLRNPVHGEVEFCNLWPAGAFPGDGQTAKCYQACYVQRRDAIVRIPHHHLETSDKENIILRKGDRFLWLLQDSNPVFELLSQTPVSAGICAYMWDAHFGYRVTESGQPDLYLTGERTYDAAFRLYAMDRSAGRGVADRAVTVLPEDLDRQPIFVQGLNTFSHTAADFFQQMEQVWPWSHEVLSGSAEDAVFTLDRQVGHGDRASLRIDHHGSVTSRWLATTLGPAFGGAPFIDGARHRLSGYVRTQDLEGEARLLIRLHNTGQEDLFKPENYTIYSSPGSVRGTTDWQYLEVLTPPISPAPDRMHLVLQQTGRGRSWFDDILVEMIT